MLLVYFEYDECYIRQLTSTSTFDDNNFLLLCNGLFIYNHRVYRFITLPYTTLHVYVIPYNLTTYTYLIVLPYAYLTRILIALPYNLTTYSVTLVLPYSVTLVLPYSVTL